MLGSPTLCLTLDNMGYAVRVGQRLRAGPDPEEESLRIGYPTILALLDRLGLKATFFIEGWNALHHPDRVRELVERGHEVGLHGWVHERYHELDEIDAERVLIDAQAAFRAIGIETRGFRAPGGWRGPYAAGILRKLGLDYDSSVDPPAEETEPGLIDDAIVNIPWRWDMVDAYLYHLHPEGARSPAQLEALWCERLDAAVRDQTTLTVILHALVSGMVPEQLAAAERVLRYAQSLPGLQILTAGEVAAKVRGGRHLSQ